MYYIRALCALGSLGVTHCGLGALAASKAMALGGHSGQSAVDGTMLPRATAAAAAAGELKLTSAVDRCTPANTVPRWNMWTPVMPGSCTASARHTAWLEIPCGRPRAWTLDGSMLGARGRRGGQPRERGATGAKLATGDTVQCASTSRWPRTGRSSGSSLPCLLHSRCVALPSLSVAPVPFTLGMWPSLHSNGPGTHPPWTQEFCSLSTRCGSLPSL